MDLREAKSLGMLDHHERGIGHIHAHFNDGRGDQHVDLTPGESSNAGCLFIGGESAMQQADVQIG